jgi:hypothetical protein
MDNSPSPISTSVQHMNTEIGAIRTFGTYPQTTEGGDRTPIQWRVLKHTDNGLYLLSEYLLDCRRYHHVAVETTWRDCDLRAWLHDGFYQSAFNKSEQQCIKTTLCTGNGEGCTDTEDKVFLPSVAEVNELIGKRLLDSCGARRLTVGTPYAQAAKADGCRLYVYDKSIKTNYIMENGVETGCSWWWLRTRGNSASRANFIGTLSSIRSYGSIDLPYYGVRPALVLQQQ